VLHVTHPEEYAVTALIRLALEGTPWLDIRLDPALGDRPADPLARVLGCLVSHLTPHWRTTRRYDRTRLTAATPRLPPPGPVTADYLRAGMRRVRPERPAADTAPR
jgi:hypothetical protein